MDSIGNSTGKRTPGQAVRTGRGPRRRMRALAAHLPGVTSLIGVGYYLRDPQAPLRQRMTLLASLVYLISPIDLIPEMFLGPLGLVDDTAVALGLIRFLFSRTMKSHREQARRWLRDE